MLSSPEKSHDDSQSCISRRQLRKIISDQFVPVSLICHKLRSSRNALVNVASKTLPRVGFKRGIYNTTVYDEISNMHS